MNIRSAAKALIIQEEKLLTIKCLSMVHGYAETYFVLPGGGQRHGESLIEALCRECQEEINVAVEVQDLAFIREYIGKHHGLAGHKHAHQIDHFFYCTILTGQPNIGHTPDIEQVGIEWIALDKLESINFYPRAMRKLIATHTSSKVQRIYLGDIN